MRPSLLLKFLSSLLKSSRNVHQIVIGMSPLVIEQTTETASSGFISSSPKEKGLICGKALAANVQV